MEGETEITINIATMRKAVEHFLASEVFHDGLTGTFEVTDVSQMSGTQYEPRRFVVKVKHKPQTAGNPANS